MTNIPQVVNEAHQRAASALKNSYAPYSKLHVGCGLKLKNPQQIVVGVNVENASYGGTICAERSAVMSAISQHGDGCGFEFAVIISDKSGEPIPPCGMCLQVFKEFVGDDFMIYLGDSERLKKSFSLGEFLPHSFSSEQLP